ELVLEQPEVESTDVLAPTPLRSVPGGSTSTEEETETPPLNVEATSDSFAPVTHAGQSPPQTSPLTADDISRRDRETASRAGGAAESKAVKYLEGGKNNHFTGLDEFCQRVDELLEKQEEKLRQLSIEYDEELYPHMLSAIAECM
ncbi:hypothetical protein Tco_1130806, partial [Tanacetum coccineum]